MQRMNNNEKDMEKMYLLKKMYLWKKIFLQDITSAMKATYFKSHIHYNQKNKMFRASSVLLKKKKKRYCSALTKYFFFYCFRMIFRKLFSLKTFLLPH